MFPLQLDCSDPRLEGRECPPDPLAHGETYLTFVLAKTHRAIRIASAAIWPDTECMSVNEFTMEDIRSGWCMRIDEVSGRAMLPGLRRAFGVDGIMTTSLCFEKNKNKRASTRRLATLILASAHSSHSRVLVVLATGYGCSYIFLAAVSSDEGIDAPFCREALFEVGKPRPWLKSDFVGTCIPFGQRERLKLRMGRYTVNIDYEDHTLTSKLAFRLTVGLGPLQSKKEDGDAKQNHQLTKALRFTIVAGSVNIDSERYFR